MAVYNSKISPQLQLMLSYQNLVFPISFIQTTGIRSRDIWEVLVTYSGGINNIDKKLYEDLIVIDEMFAIIILNKDNIIKLSEYPNIKYIELPEVMQYILNQGLSSICTTGISGTTGIFDLTGKGTLLGIIDSGIDYTHPDFIRADGTSRIRYLWDQTIPGNPPAGFKVGTVYTNEQINEALKASTKEEALKIVPSTDVLGHGTAVAGVAGGNGRLSNGKYTGVAPESEFIVVKVGQEGISPITIPLRGPRNIEIMLAIKYVLERAVEVDKPVSILIGFGINEGAHDGTSALEIAIDRASDIWKNNIVVGVGNQANKDSHTQGKVSQDEVKEVQIFIDQNQEYYYATLWKNFADDFGIVIEAPNGERTELLTRAINNRAFVFGNTVIMINFSEPSPSNQDEQILMILDSFDSTTINSGVWKMYIIGLSILEGNYNIWGEAIDPINRTTRFLNPSKEITLTIPSTSNRVTSVAASDKQGNQIASFSGRGFTRTGKVKPDITAPGVDIITASNNPQNRYEPISGTSIAGAFVAGAYALLMQYGIVEGRDEYLYGERLKAYVLRNAKRSIKEEPYPNKSWGYGELCVRDVLNELREKYSAGN